MVEHTLCELHEISLPGSRGFNINGKSLFVVRTTEGVFGYVNRCPHLGVELDWVDHQFLDSSLQLIQCATHGALFQTNNGYCVSGPCSGEHLTAVTIDVKDGVVTAWL